VFKVSRDEQGARLTHIKITGGCLRVRDEVEYGGKKEKITRMRLYSGAKFTPVEQAVQGDVVAVLGLSSALPGQGLGAQRHAESPMLCPVFTYTVTLPESYDIHKAMQTLKQLEEEEPQLGLMWDERLKKLVVQLMGPIQLEVFAQLVRQRLGCEVEFDSGHIIYRETIAEKVEGVGHYEPLRHYAEVHLVLEPLPAGSGVELAADCPEGSLAGNWQRLILTHLAEKQHLGVLTGSPITDVKITLTAGRAHEKHTEGGDFREATYRAVRQGLMQANSVLLEPWYDFRLELPAANVGRAMTDLQRMNAKYSAPVTAADCTIIEGSAPAAAIAVYPEEIASYTHGLGRFSCVFGGYRPCSQQDEVVAKLGYDPEADLENTPDSVFCAHGAGYNVKWSQVPQYMHLPSTLAAKKTEQVRVQAERYVARMATDAELMAIFERTYGPIKHDRPRAMRPVPPENRPWKEQPRTEITEYVLVDGYNIIFAWDDLRELAEQSLDAARRKLTDRLRNYQAFRNCPVILVFDAYKVKNNPGSIERFGGLSVVYTKEAETADMYIEKTTSQLARSKKSLVRVATSDGLEQVIILSHGALRLPASVFEGEVKEIEAAIHTFLTEK